MANVTLTYSGINSGTAVKVLCDQVTIGGQKNLTAKPNANIDGPVEVQTNSFENLAITLQGVHYLPQSLYNGSETLFTWDDVLTLYQHSYNGSNQIILNVTYGDEVALSGLQGTNIPVVMKNFSLPINVKDTRNGYLPIGTINFIETE